MPRSAPRNKNGTVIYVEVWGDRNRNVGGVELDGHLLGKDTAQGNH